MELPRLLLSDGSCYCRKIDIVCLATMVAAMRSCAITSRFGTRTKVAIAGTAGQFAAMADDLIGNRAGAPPQAAEQRAEGAGR